MSEAKSTLCLVFDTETDGLCNNHQPPEHPSQPHLVQLAALLIDEATGAERASLSLIVRQYGRAIPAQATAVHGITAELSDAAGVPLIVALAALSHLAKAATHHVAHNADFDVKVIQAAFCRVARPAPPLNPRCTKELSASLVNLPPTERMIAAGFGGKPKTPTLNECFRFFFDEDLVGAHDAMIDARACARVYLELMRRGAVQ